MFNDIYTKYGKIDILVNNAGISATTDLVDYTIEEYDKIMDINVKAVFVCSKEVVNLFLFLGSDLASYVTGTVISVDGATIN